MHYAFSMAEQLNQQLQAGAGWARQYAALVLDATERLGRLQFDTAQALWAEGSTDAREALAGAGGAVQPGEFPKALQQGAERVARRAEVYARLGGEYQSALRDLLADGAGSLNRHLAEAVQQSAWRVAQVQTPNPRKAA